MAEPAALVLFRTDLRVADNGALAAAADSGKPVVAAFVLDERDGIRPRGGASRWWLHHSLAALRRQLDRLGTRLVLRRGPIRPIVDSLIAESGADLIGYAILVPMYRAQEGTRGMDLHQLFVRPEQRGHGIGQHLVTRARELARQAGCGYLSVSAATGNFAAHRFYEHMEFKARPVTGMRYMQALA